MPEIKKGDRVHIIENGVNVFEGKIDFFIVEMIKETQRGLEIDLKFKYNKMEDFLEAKIKSNLKNKFGDWLYFPMVCTRPEAFAKFRKLDIQ